MPDYHITSHPAARYRREILAVERALDREILTIRALFDAGVRLDDFEPHTRRRVAGLLGFHELQPTELSHEI